MAKKIIASIKSSSKSITKTAVKNKTITQTKKGEKKRKSSASFRAFMKTYKGLDDFHIPLFEQIQKITSAESVFYPGCHRHLSASLVFPNVVYVDNYKGVQNEFHDPVLLNWVNEHKRYDGPPSISFHLKDFQKKLNVDEHSFDLLISMSAGIVSTSCEKYIKPDGYFLVSDAHFDARLTFLNPHFKLIAVYDMAKNEFNFSEEDLCLHFRTKKGDIITMDQVNESISTPKAKRSFKLQIEDWFYLFQKLKVD